MSDRNDHRPAAAPGTLTDPGAWTTGDEPMTVAQESCLNTLDHRAPEEGLTRAEASRKLDARREKAGVAPDAGRAPKRQAKRT
jgi:hypothetical protein